MFRNRGPAGSGSSGPGNRTTTGRQRQPERAAATPARMVLIASRPSMDSRFAPWLVLALANTACTARAPDPAPMHPPGADELGDAPARDSQASTETGSEADDDAAPQHSETTAESSSDTSGAPPSETVAETSSEDSDTGGAVACGGAPLTATFYDAGQALAALVTLPDGRRVLVDAGESPSRPGCGQPCRDGNQRVLDGLARDLGDDLIDLLWITHQHSDHLGGVPSVAERFPIVTYVDNGQSLDANGVMEARAAALEAGADLFEAAPGRTTVPLDARGDVVLTAVVPDAWPVDCAVHPNDCSIGLLVSYCDSEVLFTGDAEARAEATWNVGDIDLLQVGHHGSATSSSASFLERVRPEYAVISSGRPGEGTNRTYCHPRKSTIERLASFTLDSDGPTAVGFDEEVSCLEGIDANWDEVGGGESIWVTARDGTVVLQTSGDGNFARAR